MKGLYNVEIDNFNKDGSFELSIGPIESLRVTLDEIAQMACDMMNAHLKTDPTQVWFSHSIMTHTDLLKNYRFVLAKVISSHGAVYKQEKLVVWVKRESPLNEASEKEAIQPMKKGE